MVSCTITGDKTSGIENHSMENAKFDSLFKKNRLEVFFWEIKSDSSRLEIASRAAYDYYKVMDTSQFRLWNARSLELALKLNDSVALANSYWNQGNFFYRLGIKDSSFLSYKNAYLTFLNQGDDYKAARMLLNMSIIQNDIKDYSGSETNTIRAIRLLQPLDKKDELYSAYNNLGILANGMNEFRKSIEYHQKALSFARTEKNKLNQASSLNNIGVVYQNSGDYVTAVNFYNQAFQVEGLVKKNPKLYAMILDNMTYSLMKNGYFENALKNFSHAAAIRDSLKHFSGQVVNRLHLGEYYLNVKRDSVIAIDYFEQAKILAEDTRNNRDLLKALEFLIELDKSNKPEYFSQYVSLTDSLDLEERRIQNKFARIQYETDQFKQENKNLLDQRQLILLAFSVLVIIITLVYVIAHQRIKNRELLLEKKQKESDEEIYNLLITQRNKLEEGSMLAKSKISSELHDGVLGKLFGIRLTLASLNESYDSSLIEKRAKSIDELQNVESEIRNLSHDLVAANEEEEMDLLNIIRDFIGIQEVGYNGKIYLSADSNIKWHLLNSKAKINIYRCVQEIIFNALKYSESSEIRIEFHSTNDSLKIIVADNGKGFKVSGVKKGLGLKNISSRIKDMNGKLKLNSDAAGTCYTFSIPINI